MTTLPPAPRPCRFCPYRMDVPSGVWSREEYEKLKEYDQPTWGQPTGVFRCHVHERDDEHGTACGGWAGCHDGDELMALRVGTVTGEITPETAEAIRDYVSPVALFASGTEAAEHGLRDIDNPGPEARAAMDKIERIRNDIKYLEEPMEISCRPLPADGQFSGRVVSGPVIEPHPADTTARAFRVAAYLAQLGEHDGRRTLLWVQVSGPTVADSEVLQSMALHLPLLPEEERQRQPYRHELPDGTRELAELIWEQAADGR